MYSPVNNTLAVFVCSPRENVALKICLFRGFLKLFFALFCSLFKKGFGKVIGGLASLYDITGYISDLLSYSRLLALGLTTGVMAQVFNMLSTMFGKSWFGIILLIIVFIIGHAINIGLNALGSYVHTMRLQYVEMFGKFYEGGGKQFKPFKLNSKYIKIQEDKSK